LLDFIIIVLKMMDADQKNAFPIFLDCLPYINPGNIKQVTRKLPWEKQGSLLSPAYSHSLLLTFTAIPATPETATKMHPWN
jgi:hypothetical protein